MPPKRARDVAADEKVPADDVVARARRGAPLDPANPGRLSRVDDLPQGGYVSTLTVARKEGAVQIGAPGYMFLGMNLTSGATTQFVCDTALADSTYYTTMAARTETVTRTQLIGILESARDAVVKVTFHKKPNPDEQEKLLEGAQIGTRAQRVALVKQILQGEPRDLTGIVRYSDRDWGRTAMLDLDVFYAQAGEKNVGAAERQVDHRSLMSVTYKNVRYEVRA